MKNDQFVEGLLEGCKKANCECTCCDGDQVEEWVNEYFAFHERTKDYLAEIGIKISFVGDRVRFENCSDGKECKFLKFSLNKDIDPRPIDCKIFPYVVDWEDIDFDNKIVHLYYWDKTCPLTKKDLVPESFRKEVESIIKRDFAVLFYGTRFKVVFVNDIKTK
ncbi:MAG: hypothetical protein WCW13_00920 [archaeon]|jgi:hypothetical protein